MGRTVLPSAPKPSEPTPAAFSRAPRGRLEHARITPSSSLKKRQAYGYDIASGCNHALDARTGALRWSWNPIPQDPRNRAAKTWKGESRSKTGAANAWSVIVADPARHLVFVPTGSASPDYYGGERVGDDKWANSVVALDARSGKLVWGFQLVHYDLWDYDTASPPLVATLVRAGARIPVVIQGNKTGNLFVLNRASGVPVFTVEERPVPRSDVPV